MKALTYSRFSPRPDAQLSESIETQQDRARSWCHARDLELIGHHADREMSGGRADNRPGLQEAIERACSQKAIIVVYSLSRLARNAQDCLAIVEKLTASGAGLASVTEPLDTTSASGRLFLTILAAMAEWERATIAERTSDGMRRRQASGQRMSRHAPIGWKLDPARPGHMLPCEDERAAFVRIRELDAEGLGGRKIARTLTAEGFSFRGTEWSHQNVLRVLAKAAKNPECVPPPSVLCASSLAG